jgi:GNAT superfamily N-acetyltransferase
MTKMNIQIRLARLEDTTTLASLISESARTLQANYYTPEQIEGALGTVFGVDSQLIQDGTYFIAKNVHQIIGCGGWSKRKTLYGGDSRTVSPQERLRQRVGDSQPAVGTASACTERLHQRGKEEDEDHLLDPSVDAAKIRAFFIHPDWARRGIGSQIMTRCEAAALEAGFKTIEIIATLAGEPLYSRFGYHVSQKFEISLPNKSTLPVVRMIKNFAKNHSND